MDRKRVIQDFNNAETTVFGAFSDACKRYNDAPALGFFGESISYSTLLEKTERTAKALIEAGVKPGDAVTCMLPNCPQAIMVYYAISRIGAVANMIHTLSSPQNIAFYLSKAHSRFIIALDMMYPKIKEGCKNVDYPVTIIYTSLSDEMSLFNRIGYKIKTSKTKPAAIKDECAVSLKDLLVKGTGRILPNINYDKDHLSTIIYSGGSTGTPKGVCLSDYNINALGIQVGNGVDLPIRGTKFLAIMPLFHGFGLGVGIHTFLNCGAQCILEPRFTVDEFIKILINEKINMVLLVPSLLEAILRSDALEGKDLSFLKGIFCGGDAVPQDLQIRVNAFLKQHNCNEVVRQGYGLSEAMAACFMNPIDKVKMNSIGIPLGEMKARIVKQGTFEDVGVNECGELILNGPSVMLGYLDEPEETAATLRKDEDGSVWLFTGDMCRMDEDGYVFFVQRIKRMIITNGYNVYPTQVEKVIWKCESVKAVCVVGVKDKMAGQRVVACIILKDGEDPKKARTDIINLCKNGLEEFAVPTKIEFLEEFPLTNMGKTNFTELEKMMNEKRGTANNV